MKDLIEALTIFAKYQQETRWPTSCEHDVMYIMGVAKKDVPENEQTRLSELGFSWSDTDDVWFSYRFGSA